MFSSPDHCSQTTNAVTHTHTHTFQLVNKDTSDPKKYTHMHTHTHRLAGCHMCVLRSSQSAAAAGSSKQGDETKKSCVFVSSRQACRGRHARSKRIRRGKGRKNKVMRERREEGKGNLHNLQTEANHWFTCLDRYSFTQTLSWSGTSNSGCFLHMLPRA